MAERYAALLSKRDLFRKSGALAITVGLEPYLRHMLPSDPSILFPPPFPRFPDISPTADISQPVDDIPKSAIDAPRTVDKLTPNPRFLQNGPRDSMNIALTFDACMTQGMARRYSPDSWHNDNIIKILNYTHTPASFYICGLYAEIEPDFTRSLATNPSLFRLGQHSFDHPGFEFTLSTVTLPHITSDSQKIAEIKMAQDSIKKITGVTPIDFRFPADVHSEHDIDLAYGLGLTSVGIEVTGDDGFNNDPDKIIRKVLNQTRPGSIIGLHILGRPNAPVTDKALTPIISGLRSKGFNFVTVPQLANLH